MRTEIEKAMTDIIYVLSNFRGTVEGNVLTAKEQIGIANSVNKISSELERLSKFEESTKGAKEAEKEV